jgi:polysaccharide export outer membrane protein
MIKNSVALGLFFVLATSVFAVQSTVQEQPAVKPPVAGPARPSSAPATSPAIIALPPIIPAPGSDAAKDPAFPKPTETQKASPNPPVGRNAKNKVDPASKPSTDPTAVGPAFVIGPEDVLFIRVWEQPELSGSVVVGPDGTISLQLIDEVKASGFTPHQLEAVLVEKLHKFLAEPEVNIQVQRVNSRMYIILGDGVNRPGIYPLTRPMTVLEALIAGGGFSTFAKKNKIYVLRGTEKYPFNWNEVSKGKKLAQNIIIQHKDQIYVP